MHSPSSITDWFDARAFDGDISRQYEAVVDDGLALIDRSDRDLLVLSGDDTIPWLQGLVTSELHDLVDPGSGQRSAVVNTTGRFIAEARLLHIPQLLLMDLEPGLLDDALRSHLNNHIIMEKVTLDDRSDHTARIGVYGRHTHDLLGQLGNWSTDPEDIPPFHGAWTRWRGEDLIAHHSPWMEAPGLEIICAAGVAPDLLEHLEHLFDGDRMPTFGHQAFEVLRIEAGIPRHGVELDDRVIPLEATFDDAIDYDKGCYLGQEIIARLDTLGTPAKLLRKVHLDTPVAPEPDTDVLPEDGEGRAIGSVKSSIFSPQSGCAVAMAFIKRGHNDIGHTVRIGDQLGTLAPLTNFQDPSTPDGATA